MDLDGCCGICEVFNSSPGVDRARGDELLLVSNVQATSTCMGLVFSLGRERDGIDA